MSSRTRKFLHWSPAISCMAFIFYLSSRSSFPGGSFIADWDKILHAIEYAFLSLCCFHGFYQASPLSGRSPAAWLAGALLATLYAASDEWHQSMVPERAADLGDFIADTVGAFAAGIFLPFYPKKPNIPNGDGAV